MTISIPILISPFLAFLLSWLGTGMARIFLRRAHIIDRPNARSNHATPIPRGGGIAMSISALFFLWLVGVNSYIIAGAALLAVISFADDVRGLPAAFRLLAQLIAVSIAIHTLPGRLFPDAVPYWMEWGLIAFFWVWFINLTNFMDGIDGITSMQFMAMMLGLCLLRLSAAPPPVMLAVDALVLAAAVLGFYPFNRTPATLFMGDVGSITLGFLGGYLLLLLAVSGLWCAALILPAYYLGDATFTLLNRIKAREKIWQAHSQHAYQKAVRGGMGHRQVVCRIGGLNIILVMLAMLSTLNMMAGIAALCIAYALTACLMRYFSHVASAQ